MIKFTCDVYAKDADTLIKTFDQQAECETDFMVWLANTAQNNVDWCYFIVSFRGELATAEGYGYDRTALREWL